VNQVQSPVARIQADDARAHSIEPDRPGEQGLGEGRVVAVGWRQEEEEGQARAAAQQRVDPIAQQQGMSVMMWGMADGGIGVVAAPGEDRGALDDEVAPANEAQVLGEPDAHDQQHLIGRSARLRPPRHCWEALGTYGRPWASADSPQANANAGQATSQSWRS
jgi:hypothetical protein